MAVFISESMQELHVASSSLFRNNAVITTKIPPYNESLPYHPAGGAVCGGFVANKLTPFAHQVASEAAVNLRISNETVFDANYIQMVGTNICGGAALSSYGLVKNIYIFFQQKIILLLSIFDVYLLSMY